MGEAPAAIRWLQSQGVGFTPPDPDEPGELHLTREGGHARRRIVHAADATGKAIIASLEARVAEHPQRITLAVDDADPRTPPIQVMATMLAGSSCSGVAMSLSLLLEKRGCQARSGESRVPGYDFSVRLWLPGDSRFTNVVVEALNRGAWGPPGLLDLRLVAESLPPAPPPHY